MVCSLRPPLWRLAAALVLALTVDAAALSRRHGRRHHKEVAVATQPQPPAEQEAAAAFLATGSRAGASSSSQEETAMSNAVDAAADLDAEAVVQEAEKEADATATATAQLPPAAPAQATNLVVAEQAEQAAGASSASKAAGGAEAKDKEEDADADEEDEEDDDDDDDTAEGPDAKAFKYSIPNKAQPTEPVAPGDVHGAPGSVVTMREDPGEGKTLEATYGVHDGVLRGESLTPQGRLAKARQRLQDNLYQQTKINALIWQMGNETRFQSDVDAESSALAQETQAKALATMLSGMRKEMRKFAAPFYLEHLVGERRRLKQAEVVLQADLDAAEAACGEGHQGWPHPGDKVVVAESTYRKPALRGSEEGDADDEDEVKELKISIPKMESSLLQSKKQQSPPAAEKSGACRRVAGSTFGLVLLKLLL